MTDGIINRLASRLTDGIPEDDPSLEKQLVGECKAMIKYASASGLTIPPVAVESVRVAIAAEQQEGEDPPATPDYKISIRRLVAAHRQLSKAVAPATPRTILLLDAEKPSGSFSRLLGPIRLVRQMMVFAIVLLVGFVVLLAVTDVGSRDPTVVLFNPDVSVRTSILNALFLLSAAGLGGAFAGLFKANRHIAAGSFDPKYESSYWIMIVLGLIAGVILAQLLPPKFDALGELTKPLLALLGGFSAPAVYRVLERLVQTVEALVQGDAREIVDARAQVAKARGAAEVLQTRMALAAKALKLQGDVMKEDVSDEVKERLTKMLDDLLPPEVSDESL